MCLLLLFYFVYKLWLSFSFERGNTKFDLHIVQWHKRKQSRSWAIIEVGRVTRCLLEVATLSRVIVLTTHEKQLYKNIWICLLVPLPELPHSKCHWMIQKSRGALNYLMRRYLKGSQSYTIDVKVAWRLFLQPLVSSDFTPTTVVLVTINCIQSAGKLHMIMLSSASTHGTGVQFFYR